MFRIPSKPTQFLAPMLAFAAAVLFLSRFLEFPTPTSPLPTSSPVIIRDPFTDLVAAFGAWDAKIGCPRFRDKYKTWTANSSAVQDGEGGECAGVGIRHVSVLVKGWTWIPDNLENLYSCRCGLSCLWTKSPVLADRPDALLFENVMLPARHRVGDPLRVYMDLEATRKPSGFEDIFIGYHAKDDVQSTYVGALHMPAPCSIITAITTYHHEN